MSVMRIVCLSDTHLRTPVGGVPDGDVLVHAGDLTMGGTEAETEDALNWLDGLPHQHKLVIAGNHDFLFEGRAPRGREVMATHPALTYLQDSAVTIGGLRFWGTPWQPWFYDWAFNLRRGAEIRAKWKLIPPDTDVLIVHGPPAGWLDRNSQGEECGCADLLAAIKRIGPKLVVFGHIHEGYGEAQLISKRRRAHLVNASICDADYQPVNRPVVVDLG
jgi:Icc-related predicted phosphoesterase